eukprot:CAMPEP_0183729608 /NCGR_PEP_ID=MMETSP0737-20130205/30716_1 /TAXON_ID=385413 /ORGANISM="Thalassiosira miniscula, Strain CCMP1093" /LENGTH=957 /DNA_ID=CAMNT_0025961841 /DNA_START=49 /DNA_END=2922 /DNA_ORIENTATION=+
MDSSFGRAESDIYRMEAYDESSDATSSAGESFVEEIHNDDDDLADSSRQHQQNPSRQSQKDVMDATPQQAEVTSSRPPPVSTHSNAALDDGANSESGNNIEVVADTDEPLTNARVSFNEPQGTTVKKKAAAQSIPSSTMIHFQNPKRYNPNSFISPYPTQNLRSTNTSAADTTLDQVVAGTVKNGRNQRGPVRKALSVPTTAESSVAEVTPAFLRRAAQDIGLTKTVKASNQRPDPNTNPQQEPVPPNTLMYRRDRPAMSTTSNNIMNSSIPDSSFYGADASALDGTFVSIRDLNDDDDVPSVDNVWDTSIDRKGDGDASFPTETTSLLGSRAQMPWQGGFFGSQMEKEDRRERRKMMARRGLASGWMHTLLSFVLGREKNGLYHANNGGRVVHWEENHPIGNEFAPYHRDPPVNSGGLPRQRVFSQLLIGVLCFHMAMCGLHDLFLRYLSYRNPYSEGEAEVSWNGEGQYIPAYWMSFEGRVLNPLVGPGARTLTAFGAMVPGLVLSKGQVWRVASSLFQTSSFVQLMLHIWALKTALGGPTLGLEWKRGTFIVSSLYLISALVGSAWSIVFQPERLISASGMGITGLLGAASVERICFPLASKDDEDNAGINGDQTDFGSGSNNAVTSSSNEQFTYQPPNAQKKKRRNPLKIMSSPTILLLLEILTSWWAVYASLVGTVSAAAAGVSCALFLFVGSPPPGFSDANANQDLLLSDDPPPPPPPPKFAVGDNWKNDDDSADTSIGSGRQAFNTPLMRRSILADEDEEDAPLGTRASLRKRNVNSSSARNPGKGHVLSTNNKRPTSASHFFARVVGMLLALLLTMIPATLIATGEDPSNEATRASVLGCKPMRVLYRQDDSSDRFECAGGCIPLSRERMARKHDGMRVGRCDTIGYRCWQQSGTMTLRNYEVNVGIYTVPENGYCADINAGNDGEHNWNNDDANAGDAAYNGEVEGVQ